MTIRTTHRPISISDSHRRRSDYWTVFSLKANRPIELFSALEYDHWLLTECNPEVISLCEKPIELNVGRGAQKCRHTFDLWVQWRSGLTEYVSVLSKHKLVPVDEQLFLPRNWCEISEWSEGHGMTVRFVTDEMVNLSRKRLNNYRIIYPYVSQNRERKRKDVLTTVVALVNKREEIVFQEVLDVAGYPPGLTFEHCLQAIYDGAITASLDTEILSLQSKLRAIGHG